MYDISYPHTYLIHLPFLPFTCCSSITPSPPSSFHVPFFSLPSPFSSLSPLCCTSPSPNCPPDVGYAQGMNDILTRFLVVTNSEVDSYWMFACYMERKRIDFLEETMMKKVGECACVFTYSIVMG